MRSASRAGAPQKVMQLPPPLPISSEPFLAVRDIRVRDRSTRLPLPGGSPARGTPRKISGWRLRWASPRLEGFCGPESPGALSQSPISIGLSADRGCSALLLGLAVAVNMNIGSDINPTTLVCKMPGSPGVGICCYCHRRTSATWSSDDSTTSPSCPAISGAYTTLRNMHACVRTYMYKHERCCVFLE